MPETKAIQVLDRKTLESTNRPMKINGSPIVVYDEKQDDGSTIKVKDNISYLVKDVYEFLKEKQEDELDSLRARGMTEAQIKVYDAMMTSETIGQTIHVRRELEHIDKTVREMMYARLEKDMFFTTSNEGGDWANQVTYVMYNSGGEAKPQNVQAFDIPEQSLWLIEATTFMADFGTGYSMNEQELIQAKRAKFLPGTLEGKYQESAERAYLELKERIAFYGMDGTGPCSQGFLNHEYMPIVRQVPNGVSGDSRFSKKTPIEILADLFNMEFEMWRESKMIWKPDTMHMSMDIERYLRTTFINVDLINEKTLFQCFVENSKFIKEKNIKVSLVMTNAGTVDHGVGQEDDLIILYASKDPQKGTRTFVFREPMPLKWGPMHRVNWTFSRAARGRIGGIVIFYVDAIRQYDGIGQGYEDS